MRTKISIAVLAALIIGNGRQQAIKERAFISKGETSMTLEGLVPLGAPSLLDGGYQLTDVIPEDYGVSQIGARGPGWSWPRPGFNSASNTKRITVAGGSELTVTARRPRQ